MVICPYLSLGNLIINYWEALCIMGVLRVKERLRGAITRCFGEATEGQGLVEYALILVLVALVAFVVVVWLGPWVGNVFSNVIFML